MKKLFVIFIIIIFSACVIYAQNPQKPDDSDLSWRYMLEAQIDYEYGRYGDAVRNADIAKQKRKNEIDWVLFAMNQALKSPEVQKAGDNIEEITKLLKKRITKKKKQSKTPRAASATKASYTKGGEG